MRNLRVRSAEFALVTRSLRFRFAWAAVGFSHFAYCRFARPALAFFNRPCYRFSLVNFRNAFVSPATNTLFNLARVGDNDLGSAGKPFASRRARVFAAGALNLRCVIIPSWGSRPEKHS
jgi:hypothetical protein